MARGKKVSEKKVTQDPKDELLSRFVKDAKGKVRGESIGIEGKNVVIKDGVDFLMIPLNSVSIQDKILRVTKKVDWKKAEKEGVKWRKRELDPL